MRGMYALGVIVKVIIGGICQSVLGSFISMTSVHCAKVIVLCVSISLGKRNWPLCHGILI